MTDKDTKDMSASELMRYLHDRNTSCSCSMCTKVLNIVECGEHVCADAYEALADKIDAELAKARELSLRRGAELWAKANGWPDFKQGEDFGAWLERCALKLPCDKDGEPWNIGDRVIPGNRCESTVTGYSFDGADWFLKYRWCGIDSYANEFATSCKRPAPEVLGADGLPIKVGDAMWSLSGAGPLTVTSLHTDDPTPDGGDSPWVDLDDDGLYSWIYAGSLTHTPPDTLERLRDDIAEWRADCARPGSGWDVKTAEWADRIDAIIRRRGGAE